VPVLVKLPLIVKDATVADLKDIDLLEDFVITGEEVFLDGPLTPRVAILDFDGTTGQLRESIPFEAARSEKDFGAYGFSRKPDDVGDVPRQLASVSVFGTVYKTMRMFEERDALGRAVVWSFEGPQLLVVPRAGELANAFYERDSHSLQFFSFRAGGGAFVHTSQSQDIVSHETAHAILDGIAPDLYNSISPQALAIHEGVADMTALLCAFRSRQLRKRVLADTHGRIDRPTAFSSIAPQFAEALKSSRHYLRNLLNTKSLKPDAPEKDRVDPSEPHEVSEVLSGALYTVVVNVFESLKRQYKEKGSADPSLVEKEEDAYSEAKDLDPRGAAVRASRRESGDARNLSDQEIAVKALYVAAERFKRTLYRGLDYLPPGDVTLADLGRAIIASDQASHPDSGDQRQWIIEEFVSRGMAGSASDLALATNYTHPAVTALDLPSFVESDWVAYQFANGNRDLLHIPKDIPFEVRPRLDVTKLYWHRDGEHEVRECLFKVSWTESEKSTTVGGLPPRRRVTVGTTLAIDWETRQIRAILTTEASAQREERDRLLQALVEADILQLGDHALSPGGGALHRAVRGDVLDGILRIRGAARMLHMDASPEA
jgi:hypothetical protein